MLNGLIESSAEAIDNGNFLLDFPRSCEKGDCFYNSSNYANCGPIIAGNTSFDGFNLVGPGGHVLVPNDFMQAIIERVLSQYDRGTLRLIDMFYSEEREYICQRFGVEDGYLQYLYDGIRSLKKSLSYIRSNLLLKTGFDNEGSPGFSLALYLPSRDEEICAVGDVIVDEKNICLYREGALVDISQRQCTLLKQLDRWKKCGTYGDQETKLLSLLLESVGSKIQIRDAGEKCYSLDTGLCGKVDKTELQQEYKAQMLQHYMGNITVGDISLKGNWLSKKDGAAVQITNKGEELFDRYILSNFNYGVGWLRYVRDFLDASGHHVKLPMLKTYPYRLGKCLADIGSSLLLKGVVSKIPSSQSIDGYIIQKKCGRERKYHDVFLNEEACYLKKGDRVVHISAREIQLLKKCKDGRIVSGVSLETINLLRKILQEVRSAMQIEKVDGQWLFRAFKRNMSSISQKRGGEKSVSDAGLKEINLLCEILGADGSDVRIEEVNDESFRITKKKGKMPVDGTSNDDSKLQK